MDLTQARWRFQTVDDDFGTRVSLVPKGQSDHVAAVAQAIIGTDWNAARISTTLYALEEMYEALPEPPAPPVEDGVIIMDNT